MEKLESLGRATTALSTRRYPAPMDAGVAIKLRRGTTNLVTELVE